MDFGWFYLITKPIFYCLDWLNGILGNFGLAIMAFTTCVKLLFFPLANYSYRSMSKMKLLGPKMQALRERLKDDPSKMQAEMMAMYRAEKVNPASGCLPMVVQIPVFFSLYKVIFTTIEMRQAPFYGWIHDLSQPDPTNVFNLFGLIPFDPADDLAVSAPGAVAADHGRHDVPAAEAEPAAARSGAGADVPVHADHLHLHAGALPGRAGDLLDAGTTCCRSRSNGSSCAAPVWRGPVWHGRDSRIHSPSPCGRGLGGGVRYARRPAGRTPPR